MSYQLIIDNENIISRTKVTNCVFQKLFLIYSFYKLLIKNVLYTTCICNQVKGSSF